MLENFQLFLLFTVVQTLQHRIWLGKQGKITRSDDIKDRDKYKL